MNNQVTDHTGEGIMQICSITGWTYINEDPIDLLDLTWFVVAELLQMMLQKKLWTAYQHLQPAWIFLSFLPTEGMQVISAELSSHAWVLCCDREELGCKSHVQTLQYCMLCEISPAQDFLWVLCAARRSSMKNSCMLLLPGLVLIWVKSSSQIAKFWQWLLGYWGSMLDC